MIALLSSIFGSLVSGVLSPLFAWLNKKQDVTLEGFRAASADDLARYQAYVVAINQANQIKLQQERSPFFGAITFTAGFLAVTYFGSIVLDSMFHLGWKIDKLPAPWDGYVWVILQSFVIITPTMPLVSAVSQWLRK